MSIFEGLQAQLLSAFERIEGAAFQRDPWTRAGAHGLSCILEGGERIERGAVLFSSITGQSLPPAASALRPHLTGCRYAVEGVSVVIHPRNPFAPTAHINVRHFATMNESWVGGGMDLTPHYLFEDDAKLFHAAARDATDQHYTDWKRACDQYFFLKHRQEARGIGGVFFDDYQAPDGLSILKRLVGGFISAYTQILELRCDTPHGDAHRAWQLERRGRYVEFNLVWDRGTAFGLQSGGRTQSILASLPPLATWHYECEPEAGSSEAALLEVLRVPKDWL